MLRIDSTPYGIHIILNDKVTLEEIAQAQSSLVLPLPLNSKGLLEVTGTLILTHELKTALLKLFIRISQQDLQRVCVLYSNSISRLQLSNLIFRSFPKSETLFLNMSKTVNHKRISREWLVYGKTSVS